MLLKYLESVDSKKTTIDWAEENNFKMINLELITSANTSVHRYRGISRNGDIIAWEFIDIAHL